MVKASPRPLSSPVPDEQKQDRDGRYQPQIRADVPVRRGRNERGEPAKGIQAECDVEEVLKLLLERVIQSARRHRRQKVGGERAQPGQPTEPANFESYCRPERLARIEVRPSRLVKATADFSKAKRNQADDYRAHDERQQTVVSDSPLHVRGKLKDAGAHRNIDQQGNQIPLPDLSL